MPTAPNPDSTVWTVVWTTDADEVPEHFHPDLDEWAGHLRDREQAAHILPDTPIFVDPRGDFDFRLMEYVNSLDFTSYAAASRRTYAYEIKWWCEFLETRWLTWDSATERDYGFYKTWRTSRTLHRPGTGRRGWVEGATWDKADAALDGLYKWAKKAGYVHGSPLPERAAARRAASDSRDGRSHSARSQRVRWVSMATYRVWRDVGLRGFRLGTTDTGALVALTEDESFRGRNVQRNAAFADLLFSSALRRQEGGSLLVPELPSINTEALLGMTAKGGRVRPWSAEAAVLDSLESYIVGTRREAVLRARREGRYDAIDAIWIDGMEQRARRGTVLIGTDAEEYPLLDLDVKTRMRLMRLATGGPNAGPEPLWLWLNEDGTPKDPHGWSKDFATASKRFGRECERLGRDPRDVVIMSPHSLRFSYALYLLVVLHQFLDRKYGWSPADPYDERNYSPAYDIVRDVLGHSSTETTRNIYLRPVIGMRRRAIISTDDAHKAIAALSLVDPRVRDLATTAESTPTDGT